MFVPSFAHFPSSPEEKEAVRGSKFVHYSEQSKMGSYPRYRVNQLKDVSEMGLFRKIGFGLRALGFCT